MGFLCLGYQYEIRNLAEFQIVASYMKECKHFNICGLKVDADVENGMCILHSTNPNKDKQDFDRVLSEHRNSKRNRFDYVVFPDTVDFQNVIFEEDTHFRRCIFYGDASFIDAAFEKSANFSGALFNGYADFERTIFSEYTLFTASTFKNHASFIATKFKDRVHFHNASFVTAGPSFSAVEFVKGANFTQVNFQSAHAKFIDCLFSGNTIFQSGRNTIFQESGNKNTEYTKAFSGARLIEFIFCKIDASKPMIFRNADMSVVSFHGTRLLHIEFTDILWPKINDFFGFKRLALYDEIENLKQIKSERDKDKAKEIKASFINKERIYRDLKNNYQNDKDWERAGDFHYGEKEMRRKNPNTDLIHRFFLTLYWILSGYGERYLRPLFWTIFILLVSTIGYLMFGIAPDGDKDLALKFSKINDWFNATLYSLQLITLQRPSDLQPVTLLAKTLNVLQGILGPILLGFFALAIRQRFKR